MAKFPSFARYWHDPQVRRDYPCYGFDAPGMPPPGPDFAAMASYYTGSVENTEERDFQYGRWLEYLYCEALYSTRFQLPVELKGRVRPMPLVPGQLWGFAPDGPRPAEVMVIGKNPGREETDQCANFVGSASEPLADAIDELHLDKSILDTWYVTNLVKHQPVDPAADRISSGVIKNCLPLLHNEIRLVQPKFIVCFGADAGKALLQQQRCTVTSMFGRVVDYRVPLHLVGEEERWHTCKVMVVTHPAAVHHRPELRDEFYSGLELFWNLTQGAIIGQAESDIVHRTITHVDELRCLVDQLIAEKHSLFAIDAEWHGEAPSEPGAYLRSIQFAWAPKHAVTVALRGAGGRAIFHPQPSAAAPELCRLFKGTRERPTSIGGHFFRADLPWLVDFGVDLRADYAPPRGTTEERGWVRAQRGEGGWDTAHMLHALYETGPFKLEYNASRLCRVPRYDVELERWKINWCKDRGLKASDLEGYGECPDDILFPYGAYDADATLRLRLLLGGWGDGPQRVPGRLDADRNGVDCWEPYWRTHRASPSCLEMEMTGIRLDWGRGEELTKSYQAAREARLTELRRFINWPDFNPNSAFHCREVMFGTELNGSIDKETGKPSRKRPLGCPSYGLTPVKTTGKRAKSWDRVLETGDMDATASTDKEVLGILSHSCDGEAKQFVSMLRDVRFVGQVLTSVLRRPQADENEVQIRDEYNRLVFSGGLMSAVRHDGRVRSRISQNKETGRGASSNPPLMNLSSRREKDYKRILGAQYRQPLRSLLCASPGMIMIESDVSGAELAALAWESGDKNFISDVARIALPKGHPDKLDMHSRTAVQAFRLNCEPTEDALIAAGLKHLRTGAKTVNFSVPYQSSATAIARKCQEEGANVTEEDAQAMIDFYYTSYPDVYTFLESCKQRTRNPGWICGAWGRKRRFEFSEDRGVQGEQERQACNFPIQNYVADFIWEVLYRLRVAREKWNIPFRILLQIHDAVLLEAAPQYVETIVTEILPWAIRELPTYPRGLDGSYIPRGPYFFGSDTKLYRNWGVPLNAQELRDLGINPAILAV